MSKFVEEIKLCPFRKRIFALKQNGYNKTYQAPNLALADFLEEEFLPCMKKSCMCYNEEKETCNR